MRQLLHHGLDFSRDWPAAMVISVLRICVVKVETSVSGFRGRSRGPDKEEGTAVDSVETEIGVRRESLCARCPFHCVTRLRVGWGLQG